MFLSLRSTMEPFSPAALVERESQAAQEQMRQRWESLRLELKTKLQLLQKTLEQDHKQPVRTLLYCELSALIKSGTVVDFLFFVFVFLQVYSRASRVTTAGSLFKGETQADKSSLKTLYDSFRQTIEDMTTQVLQFL